MSTQQVLIMVPPRTAAPRGAHWAALCMLWLADAPRGLAMSALGHREAVLPSPAMGRTSSWLRGIGRSIWSALEATGQRRAARELNALAERWESFDPALARQMREASGHQANH